MPVSRFLYAILIVVAFSFFMNRRSKRQRETAWKGVLTEIRHQRAAVQRDENRRDDDWVTLGYRTDEGQEDLLKVRMRVFRQLCAGVQPGDRLIKHMGAYLPTKEAAESTHSDAAPQS